MKRDVATYWMWASLTECSVLLSQFDKADRYLTLALKMSTERWEPRTTLLNLQDVAAVVHAPKKLIRIEQLERRLQEHYELLVVE
jgi:hypothetical protein